MKSKTLLAVKEHLKALAKEITDSKQTLKTKQREQSASWKEHYKVSDLRRAYRHIHIAYCLSRGTPYHKIERPSEDNPVGSWREIYVMVAMINEQRSKEYGQTGWSCSYRLKELFNPVPKPAVEVKSEVKNESICTSSPGPKQVSASRSGWSRLVPFLNS